MVTPDRPDPDGVAVEAGNRTASQRGADAATESAWASDPARRWSAEPARRAPVQPRVWTRTDPALNDPGGAEPGGADPGGADPGGAEPAQKPSAGTDPTQPSSVDPPRSISTDWLNLGRLFAEPEFGSASPTAGLPAPAAPASAATSGAANPPPPSSDHTRGFARIRGLERFFALSSQLLCIATLDGWLVEVSPSWTRTLGWTREQLTARPYLDFVHPEDVAATLQAGRALVGGEAASGFENRYRCADGTYRWLRWESVPDLDHGVIHAVVSDVTDERRRRAFNTELEQTSGIGVWELDLATQVMAWSESVHRLHGTDPATYHPTTGAALDFYPLEVRAVVGAALDRLIATGQAFDLEVPLLRADGASLWVRITGRAAHRAGQAVALYGTITDVTAAHEEREFLRHYRDLLELSEEGILEVDAQLRVVYANQRLCAMLGVPAAELMGSPAVRLLTGNPDEDSERWSRWLQDPDEPVVRGVEAIRRADGSTIWCQVAARVDRDEHGQITSVTAVLTDVSELHERQEQLASAQRYLEEAHRIAQLGHWEHDLAGDQVGWSQTTYELFARDPQLGPPSAVGFAELVHPDDRPAREAGLASVLAGGVHDLVFRHVRSDGEVRVLHERAHRDVDADGRVCRITGTLQDITEVKRTEAALRHSEDRLHRALTAANDGWWDSDLITGEAFHSERWWEIHGYRPGDLPARADLWRLVTHPEDLPRIDARFAQIVADGQTTFALNGRILRKDGSTAPVLVRGLIDYDPEGHPIRISGTTADLTELKQAEALKDEFVSTVSHELRTPLTSIGGALELIEAGVAGPVAAPMQTLFDVAVRNTSRLRLLIDDLLDMERLMTGRTTIRATEQRLQPLVERALADNAPYAETHGVRYVLEQGLEDAVVAVDADRFQQVLANLLSNAAKFAPPDTAVQVRMRASDGCVRTEVIDGGPGVPAAIADRVFDKFVQADPADQRSRGGTGLGLAITREIVERLGGQVGFDSEPGRTCFWFDLPTPTDGPPFPGPRPTRL